MTGLVRERMSLYGESRCSTLDCLTILTGSVERATELSSDFLSLVDASYQELKQRGCTHKQALVVHAAFGIARRITEARFKPGQSVRSARDVAQLVSESSRGCNKESFVSIHLNARHRVISYNIVSVGSLNSSIVSPREVFSKAIKESAMSIIIAHNHPSGDAEPSPEDRKITERLIEVGQILSITVLDHIVVGMNRYYSFSDSCYYPLYP